MKRLPLLLLAPVLVGMLLTAPARAGSVSGRVIDSSGRPIEGAKVQSIPYRDEDRTLLDQTRGTDPVPSGEVTTDAQGRFRLPLKTPGVSVAIRVLPVSLPSARLAGPFESSGETDLSEIQIPPALKSSGHVVDEAGKPVAGARVSAIGREALFETDTQFVSETRTAADGSFSMIDAPAGARTLIVLSAGLVRAQHVQIEPKGEERIVLRSGGAVRGSLIDSAGKPVAGAIVICGESAAETDASGRFEIGGIPPGTQRVETIWKEDYAARADAVRVRKGEQVEVPLKLARAASVSGSVIEEKTRKPVAGVKISLRSAGGGFFGRQHSDRSGHTDAQGRFRLGGLANRTYLVEASKDGYLNSSIPNVAVSLSKTGSVSLALRRAASVAGKILDETGQPVAGVRVEVQPDLNLRAIRTRGFAAAAAALVGRSALSGPDGVFRLRNLVPASNLRLEASKTGYATAQQPGLTLKPGDALQGLSLVLHKGLQARGRVVDGQGQPVPGAELRVMLREGGRGARAQIRMIGMDREKPDAVSGADGSFILAGLSPGQYTAVVSRDGFARKNVPSLEVKAKGENLWPPITLAPGITLSGFVRDSAAQAIAGAQILAFEPGAGARPLDAVSGPDGGFRLDGLAQGRSLMLNASADGYASAQKEVTPPTQDVVITLKSAGTIRGRVEDADAKTPVTDFTVGTRASGGIRIMIAQMAGSGGDRPVHSDDGSFELGGVAPGKWTVHVSAEGYRPADIAGVEVGEGATKEGVVFSLKRGGSLTGRALDPQSGTGVPNVSVSYQSSGSGGGMGGAFARLAGNTDASTTTDANGHFSFDGTPSGKILVTASHPDYLDVTQEVDTASQTSVDLTLGTGGSISGTVVGQDGRTPVPGAQVSLNEEGAASGGFGGNSTHADGGGGFLFEHLQAGRYMLTAQSSTGKSTNQEAVLAPGQRLTGLLIQMATGTLLQGSVVGLPAVQLGGVRILANAQNYSDNTTTDDSGKFTLSDVPAGVVRLTANTPGLSGRSTSQSIEIPDGAPQFTAEIQFQGASRLSGRVTQGDSPLSGLFVNAQPLATAAALGAGRASGRTDDNGQYALEGLNDGDYTVTLSGQGITYRRNFTVSGDTPGDIQLPAVQITGTITEAGSGEPLDSATVQLQVQTAGQPSGVRSGTRMVSADSAGHYLIDDVDAGAYQVTASRQGYQASAQTLTIGTDSASLNFSLQRGEGISIRVLDGLTGLPLGGVVVAAVDPSGSAGYQGSVALDSTGKGEISSLAPGRYAVHFFSNGYASSTAVLNAPSPLVPITLTPGGRVEVATPGPLVGRLVDASGLPYLLSPFRTDGSVSGSAPVVAWSHVAPGAYQLLVGTPGGEVAFPFIVMEGQTTRVEVK